tara:strand:- start:616 stop:1011 length:396 start_codon:yes stop_codon:yes gene_type:complete
MDSELDLNINPIHSIENTEQVNQPQQVSNKNTENDNKQKETNLKESVLKMREEFSEFASKQDFNKIVENVNNYVELFNNKVSFTMDKNSRQIIFVYNKETGDLVRQIPPEEMVQLLNKLEEISGIIFNNRA